MKRSVCYEQKLLLFQEEGCPNAWFLQLMNLANKWRLLFHAGEILIQINTILACSIYLIILMNIYIKIRFGSCICIPWVLRNL